MNPNWYRGFLWLALVQSALFVVYCAALIWSTLTRIRRWWRSALLPRN